MSGNVISQFRPANVVVKYANCTQKRIFEPGNYNVGVSEGILKVISESGLSVMFAKDAWDVVDVFDIGNEENKYESM